MNIAICTIIKDEQRYIKEWIDWHLKLGVNHIYLCEDEKSTSHMDIIQSYKDVTLFSYNEDIDSYSKGKHDSSWRQNAFFYWFMDKYGDSYDWCAFIDIDEYISIENNVKLPVFLKDYENENGLFLSWKMLGANGYIERPNKSITDAYTKDAEGWIKADYSYAFKSIVNLNKCREIFGIHQVIGGVNVLHMKTHRIRIYQKAWLNHYFSKSWEDWCERVLERGDVCCGNRKLVHFFSINPDMKSKEDEMYSFIEKKYGMDNKKYIPKIIHCCWLSGDPLPDNYKKCFDSWKKVMPDYEIKVWTSDNFDISSVKFVRQAYLNKAYAFASDYIRAWALYNYGGIYLDMDVMAYKPFDELLHLPYFLCSERYDSDIIECAIMGFSKGHLALKLIMDMYEGNDFNFNFNIAPHLYTNVMKCFTTQIKNITSIKDFDNRLNIFNLFSKDYFSPFDYDTGIMNKTENTFCCHTFASEWRKTIGRPFTKKELCKDNFPLMYKCNKDLWCIKVNKCGYTTITKIAQDYLYKHPTEDDCKDNLQYTRNIGVRGLHDKIFSIYRDPVERWLSFYQNKIVDKNYGSVFVKNLEKKDINSVISKCEEEFSKYPQELIDPHIRLQSAFYKEVDVDYIVPLRYLDDFLKYQGIEHMEHQNCSGNYHIEITKEQEETIKKLYAKDYDILKSSKIWIPSKKN